eukprot:s3816_g5.t1
MYAVLEEIKKREITAQLPPRFTIFGQGGPPCPDAGIEKWITRVKIPVVRVASLAFVSRRNYADSILHAISLLARVFRECKVQEVLEMMADRYVGSAARIIKSFINDYRNNDERQDLYHLFGSYECSVRADELWSILKDHVFFNEVIKTHWSNKPAELEVLTDAKIENIKYLINGGRSQLNYLGYALRRHNHRHRDNAKNQIIIQDVLKDWMELRYELTLERAAAVTHLQALVVATTLLYAWMRTFRMTRAQVPLVFDVRNSLRSVESAIDLPDDVWVHGGYQILKADNGAYEDIVKKNTAFSIFSNVLSNLADTQAAQGSSGVTHLENWNVPLMPGDGREPAASDLIGYWDPEPIEMRAPQAIPQPEVKDAGASSSSAGPASPKAKSRPTPPGAPLDWVIPMLPMGYQEEKSIAKDYGTTDVATRYWIVAGGDPNSPSFLLSVMQGPMALAPGISGWAQYLRRITTYGILAFGHLNTRLVCEDSACKIPADEWYRMYHCLAKTQMWTKSSSYLTSAALLVMCGEHDIEVVNQSDVGQYKKDIKNILGCEITPEANKPRDADTLFGKFRYGTTILITDIQFTVATSSGSHNFVMGLQDMGWDNVVVFKIQESEGDTGMFRFISTKYLKDNPTLVNVTIHVWLSMSFVLNPNPPHIVLAEANFHVFVCSAIQDLEELCPRPVFVAICPDSMVAGRTDEVARRLTAELRDYGILVSTSENMWRMMFSQFGHQCKILRKTPTGSAGKAAIWAAIEKTLFRQRVFLMCASDRDAVDLLNKVAHQPKYSGISLHKLRTITSPPTLFRTPEEKSDAKSKEEEYWRSVGEEGEIGASNRFAKKARKQSKAKWMDVETANLDLDPRPAMSAYWLPVNLEKETDILCRRCRLAKSFAELESVEDDARFCINCSANNQSQYKRTGPELQESQALMILATRLKVALRLSGAGVQDPRAGFKDWLINVAASFVANHGLPYGEKLMKAVSHMGGVRVPVEQVKEIFKNGRGKQFSVYRTFIPFLPSSQATGAVPAPQDGIVAYRLMKDCGNVLYKDFLTKVIDDDNKMNEIFGPTTATAEKAGDVVEFWLGLLDVASMTKGAVNVFPDDLDPSPFLNSLEEAV